MVWRVWYIIFIKKKGAPQFRFKASVFKPRNQKEEFVTMETCPSKDEAINYVATMALYKLNKDKPIYQMLPPAYKYHLYIYK